MPYINTDELLNNLPNDLPYKASVKRVLIQAPEADVVPKIEYDKLLRENERLRDELSKRPPTLVITKI